MDITDNNIFKHNFTIQLMSSTLQGERVLSADICVDCPLYGKHVPIDGACLELDLARNLDDIRNVRIPNSAAVYTPRQNCPHFTGTETRNGLLSGIGCSYEK